MMGKTVELRAVDDIMEVALYSTKYDVHTYPRDAFKHRYGTGIRTSGTGFADVTVRWPDDVPLPAKWARDSHPLHP
jgi:hypothetical protein